MLMNGPGGSLLFGRSASSWQPWFAILAQHTDYAARLNALLEQVASTTQQPVVVVYLADDPEGRFYLTHLRRPRAEGESSSPAGGERPPLSAEEWMEADAQTLEAAIELHADSVTSMAAGLPLDLPRDPRYAAPTGVRTPLGTLYSVPLVRAGVQIGILQVGPIGDKPSRRLRKTMEEIAEPLAHALALAREQARLQEQLAEYEARSDVSRQMLRSAFELDEFLHLLLDLAVKASGTQAGFIGLADDSGTVHLHTAVNLPEGLLDDVDLTPGAGFLEWLDPAEGSLYLADFEKAAALGIRALLAVPLTDAERVLGVLGLLNLEAGHTPAAHSLNLLGIFAEQIQLVLGNARLFEAFNRQFVDTLHALARALDARYPHTAAHHRRVTDWALAIGRAMGLSEAQLKILEEAGLAHDVGMCGIVEVEHGFQADYHHPTIGASMFDVLPHGQAIGEIIATHHEWYDGWGFPQGLKGDEIPVEGRILALAEFIVESTTATPLQRAMPPSKLLAEVEQRRARQFDPAIVDVWKALFERQRGAAPVGAPLQPCYAFKGEPDVACATCPARTATVPCWTIPEVRCVHHGDPDCEGCFIYLEAKERAEASGQTVAPPARRE